MPDIVDTGKSVKQNITLERYLIDFQSAILNENGKISNDAKENAKKEYLSLVHELPNLKDKEQIIYDVDLISRYNTYMAMLDILIDRERNNYVKD